MIGLGVQPFRSLSAGRQIDFAKHKRARIGSARTTFGKSWMRQGFQPERSNARERRLEAECVCVGVTVGSAHQNGFVGKLLEC